MDKNDHDLLIEIHTDVGHIKSRCSSFVTKTEFSQIAGHKADCVKTFATKEELKPVRLVAYGAVALMVTITGGFLLLLARHILA